MIWVTLRAPVGVGVAIVSRSRDTYAGSASRTTRSQRVESSATFRSLRLSTQLPQRDKRWGNSTSGSKW
jgi:hypothetical protein